MVPEAGRCVLRGPSELEPLPNHRGVEPRCMAEARGKAPAVVQNQNVHGVRGETAHVRTARRAAEAVLRAEAQVDVAEALVLLFSAVIMVPVPSCGSENTTHRCIDPVAASLSPELLCVLMRNA
jgi:hypothetical protein